MTTLAPLESTRFCILLALSRRPLHGYGIVDQIDRDANNFIHLDYSTVYKALRRLEQHGLIKREATAARTKTLGDQRQTRYRLTPAGKRTLKIEADRLAAAIELISDRV